MAFLGHRIDAVGVGVDPDMFIKIKEYPKPTNISELRTFLRLCGLCRKFVLNFSKTAAPLFDLTSAKVKWQWSAAQDEAFVRLKEVSLLRLC